MTGKIFGQYFTNPLIKDFMIELVDPQVKADGTIETIFDPAMGTGGFLISALRYLKIKAAKKKINLNYDFISKEGLGGREIEPDTYKLCRANMLISSGLVFENLERDDSIRNPIGTKYDIILANPPFGIKGMNYNGLNCGWRIKKEDYMPIPSNSAIPLFIQAMIYMLNINGKCATVVPDGQDLFGKSKHLVGFREYLMKTCDLKEIIFMPNGLFNNTNIKTCVFYFVKKIATDQVFEISGKTKKLVKAHATSKIAFYDYEPYKKEKVLLGEVGIDKISKNDYSLKYEDYVVKKAEVYGEGIQVTKLGDICNFDFELNDCKKYDTSHGKNTGLYKFHTGGARTELYTDGYDINELTIIINKTNGSGKCNIFIDSCFSCANQTIIFRSKNNTDVTTKYAYYYFLNNMKLLEDGYIGANHKNITSAYVKNIIIPFIPLSQQTELVKQLDFIYDCIKTSQTKIEQIKTVNKFIINNVSRQRGNQHMKLGDVCTVQYGKRIVKDKATPGEYPVIGGGGETFKVDTFNRQGETCKIGRFGISEENCVILLNKQYYLNDSGFTVISKNEAVTLSKFIWYYLFENKSTIYNCSQGSAQRNMDMDAFLKLIISVPSLQQQTKTIEQLNFNHNLIQTLEQEIQYNKILASEIFKNALSTQVTNDNKKENNNAKDEEICSEDDKGDQSECNINENEDVNENEN